MRQSLRYKKSSNSLGTPCARSFIKSCMSDVSACSNQSIKRTEQFWDIARILYSEIISVACHNCSTSGQKKENKQKKRPRHPPRSHQAGSEHLNCPEMHRIHQSSTSLENHHSVYVWYLHATYVIPTVVGPKGWVYIDVWSLRVYYNTSYTSNSIATNSVQPEKVSSTLAASVGLHQALPSMY